MRRWARLWTLWTIVVLLVHGEVRAGGGDIGAPVPVPSDLARLTVSRGGRYPFPWTGALSCARRFQPGCFTVEELAPGEVVVRYARFELSGGAIIPQGFGYRTRVTAAGSGYELFSVKADAGREEWVYAVLEASEGREARLQFLKLPAYVTDRARLDVRVVLDWSTQRLEELYTVAADEPLTLIGPGRVDEVFPSARLERLEVNGQRVHLRHADIIHLNLPPGRHEVSVVVGFSLALPEISIQGTLLEPRRMSLVQSLTLRVEPAPGPATPRVEVRTVGVPPEIWERFKSGIVLEPAPSAEASSALATRYAFSGTGAITLRARPRLQIGRNNYPVIITVTR